jgi:hypothetical protein
MASYRFYRLDGVGNLHSAHWFEAADDNAACAVVSEKYPDSRAEVWQGRRLVAEIKPEQRQA